MVVKLSKRKVVGLLGGSFNPPHMGHLHISYQALKFLNLDEVWWILSPKNPMKQDFSDTYHTRLEACRRLLHNTDIRLCEVEKNHGSHFSASSIEILKRKYPRNKFVWMIGADNMHFFHNWKNWDKIFMSLPIAVFSRPRQQLKAGLSLAAQKYCKFRVLPGTLLRNKPPVWTLYVGAQVNLSSSELRIND